MKQAAKLLPIVTLLGVLAFQVTYASNWPCDGTNIMDCDNGSFEGDVCGSDEDEVWGLCRGEEWVPADLFVCNGKNDNCGSQSGLCNVMVKYEVFASEVLCCEADECLAGTASRENEDCNFLGWCVDGVTGVKQALNRKCNGDPCTGPFPTPIPSTEPVLRGPGYTGGWGWTPEHIPAVP